MLPPDFDILKHGTPVGGGSAGNHNRRWGNRHVKVVEPPAHVVAPAISTFLHIAHVPHPHVSYAYRDGEHLLHAPWHDGTPIDMLNQEDVSKLSFPKAMHTVLAEWLGEIGDRHAGNYLAHGDTVIPIDFDLSGIPMYRQAQHGALFNIMNRFHPEGQRPDAKYPPASIRHLLTVAPALRVAHRIAMSGYPAEDAKAAADRFEQRLAHLAKTDPEATPLHYLRLA